MKKRSLLIIGAGASGLMAAKELVSQFNITILEAAERIGGRVNSGKMQNDIIEGGAEFIHGKLPLSLKLLKNAGLKAIPVRGKFYRKNENKFEESNEMFKGWDKFMHKMKMADGDTTLYRFLKSNYKGEKNIAFNDMITSYAEGFDLADPARVSIKSLFREWDAEDHNVFRVSGGYKSLIDYLASQLTKKGGQILTSKKVTEIKWKENAVNVITGDAESFQADKVVITLPLSKLQQLNAAESLDIFPPLPEYKEAAGNIGYGLVIKVLIKFRESFWQKDAGFILSDEKYFPTWWTQLPDTNPLLTGWCGGTKADALSNEPDENILLKGLESLASIYNLKVEELRENVIYSNVFNWQRNEFANGGYSFETLYAEAAKKVLNTPVLNTIFFAGEALYSGKSPGTVEAALESGKLTAKLIRKGN